MTIADDRVQAKIDSAIYETLWQERHWGKTGGALRDATESELAGPRASREP